MLGELQSRHPSVAMTDALVLTCFNLLDQNSKAEASADHIRGQLTEYLQDAARARIELEDANREIARLRAELDRAYHR
jgi:cell division protein ZapA